MTVRVAVTGLGAVCAVGHDAPATWAALCAGGTGIGPITGIPTERLQIRVAAEVQGFDPAEHFDARRLNLLDRASQLAIVAARQAMRDSGLAPDPAAARRRGVVLGATIGQVTLDAAYEAFYGAGSNRVHPLTVPRAMPNAPASQVSMEFGLRGPCFAAASACASSNHAIGQGLMLIRAGLADVVLAGGADASLVVGVIKSWEALRVLSPDWCRPFSADRAGLVLGEGAGVLVLERWEHATARGAVIHAELAGHGMSADGLDLTAPDAAGAAEAMEAALLDAGMEADEVGYVNAHGTGTRLNDRAEAAALHRVFAGRPPPVSSIKGAVGHCLSAAGAIEAVATVLALRDGVLPPTAGWRTRDPECELDVIAGEAWLAQARAALSNSFAFGGLNAVLAFRAVADVQGNAAA